MSTDINALLHSPDPKTVVWQVTDFHEYQRVLPSFCVAPQPGKEPAQLIRVRFESEGAYGGEDPYAGIVLPSGTKTIGIPLTHRFETFTVNVCQTIERNGGNALYLFDSLSELQTAWATDLMMGNFFRVAAPLIRKTGVSAFFPLIRGMHSTRATQVILDKTDFFLDLYSDFHSLYMRPEKVSGNADQDLFLPHRYETDRGIFAPVLDGVGLSHFHQAVNLSSPAGLHHNQDSWDRFFAKTQQDYENGSDVTEACGIMCRIMMSRDENMRRMIRDNFFPEDYFFVKEHMIGSGLIGGKACGMLTARKIIENHRPDIYEKLEPHDSFYIGSDIFYTYIVENDFWDLRVRQRRPEEYFTLAEPFARKLLEGKFSEELEDQFRHLLDYYGHSPVIVRSSSILEDGFGNAFAGKYDSVFCSNTGTPEERLLEFENAVRTVYASTMSRSALDYRRRRGLDNRDEQMALLVQRVSGSHYGNYFMPCAAGVGYSYSTYRFLPDLNPEAGMLRLVMGLGTSAVDRTEGSYPRLVNLDRPEATPYATASEHRRYSQQNIEAVNKETRSIEQIRLPQIRPCLPRYLSSLLLEHDTAAERAFRDRGRDQEICFISCRGIVSNHALMKDMHDLMAVIQKEYHHPVDIEFTMNFSETGEYIINLLQCRPLQAFHDTGKASVPQNLSANDIWVDTVHTSMGLSETLKLDRILIVDPIGYYNLPYSEKSAVARIVGAVNWFYRDRGMNMLLIVPGRIGTSSPELGVPTAFSDISSFRAVFEVAESKAGYNPELSYGSHIFQDLVENNILYMAVFEDEKTRCYRPEQITVLPNIINKIIGTDQELSRYAAVTGLYDVSQMKAMLYNDMLHERLVCTIEQHEEDQ